MKKHLLIIICIFCSMSSWAQIFTGGIFVQKDTVVIKEETTILRKGWEVSLEVNYGRFLSSNYSNIRYKNTDNITYDSEYFTADGTPIGEDPTNGETATGFGYSIIANYRPTSHIAIGGGFSIFGKEARRQQAYFFDFLVNFTKTKTSLFWSEEIGYVTGTAYPDFESSYNSYGYDYVLTPTKQNAGGMYFGTSLGLIHSINRNFALKVQGKLTIGVGFGEEMLVPITLGAYAGVIYHF